MFDWNDIRYFLAVVRGGSTLAASRSLAVNQTTVARRLAALEDALELRLFDRLPGGYLPSAAGLALLPVAEAMEREAEALARQAAHQKRHISGTIRVTTTDVLASVILMPALGAFAEVYPDVQVQTVIDDRPLDLLKGEADLAIRVGDPGQEDELVVRRLATAHWGLYCSEAYAQRRGVPADAAALGGHALLGFEGQLDRTAVAAWLRGQTAGAVIATRSNTLHTHLNAIRAGLGIGPLPRIEGDRHGDLRLCLPHVAGAEQALWLAMRPEVRGLKHARAFSDFLIARVAEMRPLFEGQSTRETA